jgi:ABC-type nitrate/sulfonate/bicarbonate transport system substrate-binding protein
MTPSPHPLSVMVFPGTQTLPLYAADAIGAFARRGLAVTLLPAPNSEEQRQGLAAGRYQIAHGAADQSVAMAVAGVDTAVVAGGDDGFNRLFVQPEIEGVADLRGRMLVADVANTGWSFVLYEILRKHGIARQECPVHEAGAPFRRFETMQRDKAMAAAILNPPFAIRARRAGLNDLGAVTDTIGPYQGTVPYVLRRWAAENGETLADYLQAMIEGLRWLLAPANRKAALSLTAERLSLPADIAAEVYAAATDPHSGLKPDAALDRDGFITMLRLRADFTGATLGPPDSYVDLSYHRRALTRL